jgi:hypothetical protein
MRRVFSELSPEELREFSVSVRDVS